MNQIKKVLRPVLKHLFWIGSVAVLLISMLSWFTARGSLKSEFDQNLTKIKTSFQSANTLKTKPAPPNEHSNVAMDRLTENAHQMVTEAWRKQYAHQENILRWPRVLGDDFVAAVRPLKPIELKVESPTPPHQELKVDFRQRYANYVERLLPSLAEVVGSTWMPGRDASRVPAARGTATGPGTPQRQPLVVWDAADQGRLLATHFDWTRQQDSAPTTLQVLYAQEDLWVLTAIMHIIRKTNGDINTRHEAVVKTINSVTIGPSAVGRSGQVLMLGGRQAGGGMGGMGGGMDDMGDGGMGTGTGMGMGGSEYGGGMDDMMGSGGGYSMDTGPGGMARGPRDPADRRYVDNEYNPLRADRVREAMQSGSPEDAFLVVAKRMPIRLQLVVDQRRLHRLLAECGNSALPVEIRQVRINRTGGRSGGAGGFAGMGGAGGYGMGGGMPGMMGMGSSEYGSGYDGGSYDGGGYGGGGYGGGGYDGGSYGGGYDGGSYGGGYDAGSYGMGGFGSSAGARRDRTEVSSTTSYDVPVELYGIIYIYNPVDEKKLRIDAAGSPTPSLTGTGQRTAPTAG